MIDDDDDDNDDDDDDDDDDDFEAYLCLGIVPWSPSRCRQNFSLQETPLSQMTLMRIMTIVMKIRVWMTITMMIIGGGGERGGGGRGRGRGGS